MSVSQSVVPPLVPTSKSGRHRVGQSLMPHFTREEAEGQRGAGLTHCHTVRDFRAMTLIQASSLQCGVLLLGP